MKIILALFLFLALPLNTFGQFETKGFNGLGWGQEREDLDIDLVCEMSFADDGFVNCEGPTLNLFTSFPVDFLTYRFYKGRLFEVSLDFNPVHLTPIINELSINLGAPEESEVYPGDDSTKTPYTFYQWTLGKSWIMLFDKGNDSPIWCITASRRLRESAYIGKDNYINNLLDK